MPPFFFVDVVLVFWVCPKGWGVFSGGILVLVFFFFPNTLGGGACLCLVVFLFFVFFFYVVLFNHCWRCFFVLGVGFFRSTITLSHFFFGFFFFFFPSLLSVFFFLGGGPVFFFLFFGLGETFWVFVLSGDIRKTLFLGASPGFPLGPPNLRLGVWFFCDCFFFFFFGLLLTFVFFFVFKSLMLRGSLLFPFFSNGV